MAYAAFRLGWYPAAIVNGEFVGTSLFQKELAAAFQYQAAAVSKEERKKIQDQEFINVLRAQVLDDLIEKKIITQALHALVGGERAGGLLDSKIASLSVSKRTDLKEAVFKLYGLDWEEFQELVVIPQAERDILKEELYARDGAKDFDEYLRAERKDARVHVFSDYLYWDGGKIQKKK